MLKKMKAVRKSIAVFMAVLLSAGIMQAQVRIGQNEAPRGGAILDLAGAYKGGLLLPRVKIDDLGRIPMDFSDASVRGFDDAPELAGMVVWNTRSGFEGVYMWDGKDWKRMEVETPLSYCSAPPVGLLASLYGTRDADGNLRIDIPSGLDARGSISPFNLTVTSDPLGSLTTVADTYNNGGVVFNPTQTWITGQLSASPTVYNLQAADMSSGTGSVTDADPWKTRQTVLTFSGESGCPLGTDTRTVTLNQTNYAIKPSVSQITFKNTNPNNFTIDANVAWKVKSIDDPASILHDITMTTSTTGGTDRSDNDKTPSIGYSVTGQNTPSSKYRTATITLEDTNVPKKANDVVITCSQCMGYTDMSSVSKIADPVQTALGDHDWNAGATKAERVVRHLAKPVDPTDLTKGNIYEEFFSGDFGSAGRWMITNLTAFYYDPDRTSVDQDVLVLNNITSYPSVETTIGWMYPGPGAATDATSLNSNPFLGLLYTQAAATNNMPSRKYDNPGTENQNLTWMEFGTGPDQVQRIQGVCPAGWHVPSHLEFVLLIKEILRNTSMYANHSDINPSESTARNVTTDLFPILDPKSSPVSSIKNSIALNVCSDVCYDGDVFGPPLSRSILDGGLSFSFSGIRGAEGAHTPDHQMYAIAGATTRKSEMIQMNNVNQERDWIQIQGLSWAFSVRCVKDLQ